MTGTTTAAEIWETTLGQLEIRVTRANFETWLRDTVGLRHDDGRFTVGAQNDFAREWLGARLRPLITSVLAGVLGRSVDVAFEVVRAAENEPAPLLPLAQGAEPARRSAPLPPALNPALTFETFVAGEENVVALEAARKAAAGKAAASPGATNPLVFCGPSGMGKTHLLNAIGHAAHASGATVIYAPAERFGNDFVRAKTDGRFEQFRARYRSADVLLIDDFQFFEGKRGFQEEFFHTFNQLQAEGRQIVVSADRMPSELADVSDALRSRLSWGLVADLPRPDFSTRLAILRAKAGRHARQLPDEVLHAIAERCCPSVRELEGYLNRVLAYVPLVGGAASLDVVERALSPFAGVPEPQPPSSDAVVEAVCRRTGAQAGALRGQSRARDVTYARHLAMYVLKEDSRLPVAQIGRLFGGRDHATVLAGVRRIGLELRTREATSEDLRAVREWLSPPPSARVG
ncbi:MAG: chromosomal replication initiator protein DnaA [Dehalococcoidia bacterium]